MLQFFNINYFLFLLMSNHQRVEHPEIQLHQQFIENLTYLENNIKTSEASTPDILFNFFSQFIRATCGNLTEPFKTIIYNAIYNDSFYEDSRVFAATHIKNIDYLEWPDKILGKIYLSDIRNRVVFELFAQHQHVITAQWTPQTKPSGTKEQNKSYLKAAHCIGSKILDPKNVEILSSLLLWMHILKLIYHVKEYLQNPDEEYDTGHNIYTFNTLSGACLYKYNNDGMTKLIWELFLDVWTYDNVG